ncbi:hypothetical protein ACQQCD_00470 [Pseudarthrobacter sp. J1763]|uniref:hypothetical protein n=1 Tax=Pseudarthrobacter sp. J1763 TaxID=3420445 RepID=UPI003D2CD8EB
MSSPTMDSQPETPSTGRRLAVRYGRPVLIAGAAVAVVCIAVLVIIFFLDLFNSTVYSVGGKSVNDATDEARSIRGAYSGVRIGSVVVLILSLIAVAAGSWGVYIARNEASDADDDGDDVDFEDLAG